MDFYKELCEMRDKFSQEHHKFKELPRHPWWLTLKDKLYSIYLDKDILIENGEIYYSCIVQANDRLYEKRLKDDCPARIIYSTDHSINSQPLLMCNVAQYILHFTEIPEELLDDNTKALRHSLIDHVARTTVHFQPPMKEKYGEKMTTSPLMIFRKQLPANILKGQLLPIIAAPEHCDTIIVLPEYYWTKAFKKAWKSDFYNI
ncbi:MAG: hypothetical protein E7478_10620 [Ruminococcaceae bacterium]|nr:hypothetical protein [Oscillospiraceae bacterium]